MAPELLHGSSFGMRVLKLLMFFVKSFLGINTKESAVFHLGAGHGQEFCCSCSVAHERVHMIVDGQNMEFIAGELNCFCMVSKELHDSTKRGRHILIILFFRCEVLGKRYLHLGLETSHRFVLQ